MYGSQPHTRCSITHMNEHVLLLTERLPKPYFEACQLLFKVCPNFLIAREVADFGHSCVLVDADRSSATDTTWFFCLILLGRVRAPAYLSRPLERLREMRDGKRHWQVTVDQVRSFWSRNEELCATVRGSPRITWVCPLYSYNKAVFYFLRSSYTKLCPSDF